MMVSENKRLRILLYTSFFCIEILIALISKERTGASGQLFPNNCPEFFTPDKFVVNVPILRGFPYSSYECSGS